MLQVVDFAIPSRLVSANQPVFLGLASSSFFAVGYQNLNAQSPPQLIISYD